LEAFVIAKQMCFIFQKYYTKLNKYAVEYEEV